jgi:hypothetical protein
MKYNWTSIWLYDCSHVWNIEYVTCEPHEWMRILWYEYSYMCTIWMKMTMRLWFSKYVYVICAPYEQDDGTMIHLHECMYVLCTSHKV